MHTLAAVSPSALMQISREMTALRKDPALAQCCISVSGPEEDDASTWVIHLLGKSVPHDLYLTPSNMLISISCSLQVRTKHCMHKGYSKHCFGFHPTTPFPLLPSNSLP